MTHVSVPHFTRRVVSEEMKVKMRRGRAGEAESREIVFVLGSTWSVSREEHTGAVAAAHRSSGTCPHTCTLTTVMEGPPAMEQLPVLGSTTPPWPSPWHRPPHMSQRRRTRMKRKMRTARQCREMEEPWGHRTTLHPKMGTSTFPRNQGWGRSQRWTVEAGK